MIKNALNTIFLCITILGLIIIEVLCAKLAYETLGEVTSGTYFLLIALNAIPLVLLVLKKQTQLAIGLILLISLIIIPYQLCLGHTLILLKEEAANITAYAYEQRLSNNAYPTDLSGYTFSYPDLQKHFSYSKDSTGNFQINYFVGTNNTSHFYHSDTKKWDYYPD